MSTETDTPVDEKVVTDGPENGDQAEVETDESEDDGETGETDED